MIRFTDSALSGIKIDIFDADTKQKLDTKDSMGKTARFVGLKRIDNYLYSGKAVDSPALKRKVFFREVK